MVDESVKTCCRCSSAKPRDQFHRHKHSADGLKAACKSCRSAERLDNIEAERARDRARHGRDRKKRNLARRHRVYGITQDAYQAMLLAQDGKCAVCQYVFTEDGGKVLGPNVDHCHTTGVVRGLLCSWCNRALGFFRDDPDRLRSAAQYLERAREVADG